LNALGDIELRAVRGDTSTAQLPLDCRSIARSEPNLRTSMAHCLGHRPADTGRSAGDERHLSG